MFKRLLPYFKYLKPVKIEFLLGIAFGIVYSIASGLGLPAIIDNVFPILFGNAEDAPSWIKNIANTAQGFSEKTGQTSWSDNRGGNNHCVCLGAWSLYNYKKNNQGLNDTQTKKLKCDAIPNYSLSQRYIKKFIDSDSQGWEEWNDNEQDNQIVDGVHSMVDECYVEGNDEQRRQLRDNYCNFAGGVDRLRNTDFYKKMC